MADTNTEKQRKFKDKMYDAGFKQMIVWVKRKEPKQVENMSMSRFVSEIKKITSGWDKERLSLLLNLLIKIAKSKRR